MQAALQFERGVPGESRRIRPQIDYYIVNGAPLAAHQLRFARRRPLKMEAAQRAGKRIVRQARLCHCHLNTLLLEFLPTPQPGKETARILVRVDSDQISPWQSGRREIHRALQ